jgi:hypothetical protein
MDDIWEQLMAIDVASARRNVTMGTLHNKSRAAMRFPRIVRRAECGYRNDQYQDWQYQMRMLPIASRTSKHRIPYASSRTLSPSSSDKTWRGPAPVEPRELSAPSPSVLLDLPKREWWLLELRGMMHNPHAKDDPYRESVG